MTQVLSISELEQQRKEAAKAAKKLQRQADHYAARAAIFDAQIAAMRKEAA